MNKTWHDRAIDYLKRLKRPRVRKHYRCGQCRERRSLKKELWQYVRPPRCSCGAIDWRLDMSRFNEWKNRTGVFNTCHCDGYHYPHRAGSGVWCSKHSTGPTEADQIERHGY